MRTINGLNLLEQETTKHSFIEELQEFIDSENRNIAIVSNINEANYVIRKIKELEEQKVNEEAEAKRMLKLYEDKVKMFLESKINSVNYEIERLRNMLEPYISSQLEVVDKKSIKFIEGTAGFRKQDILIEHDDTELAEEIKGIDDAKYFKTTKKFVWSELKKDLEFKDGKAFLNGKELENVSYMDRDDVFYIK